VTTESHAPASPEGASGEARKDPNVVAASRRATCRTVESTVTPVTTRDGTRLHVIERGRGSDVVFVHGWKGSSRVWDRVIAALEDRFHVVAFDLRGMGESDKPDSRYDFNELAGDLACVLESLRLHDVTLVGWSMGCSVALQYMASGGDRVARLMLVNGPVRLTRTDDFPWSMCQTELDGYLDLLERSWPEGELAFQRDALHEPNEAVVAWLYSIALQTPLSVALKTVRAQAKLDHRGVIRTLSVPVLAVYGRHDPYYPVELAGWIAATAPQGTALIMPQSAHLPFLERDSAAFVEAVAEFARGDSTA
jgi:non-heme chloroperoxidase